MTTLRLHNEGAKLTLHLNGPDWNGAATATVGSFSCKTVESGQNLLHEAMASARTAGLTRLIGPMDGDTWHSYRFVTESDGSPPFLMEPKEASAALEAMKTSDFEMISSYFSARVPLAEAAKTEPPETDDLTIEPWGGTEPERLFGQVFELSSEAFAGNAFYKSITREAFLAMYMPMVPLLKRELIFFARYPDGRLAGFLFGTPNYAEGPAPKSTILKTYASLARGAGRHLAHAFHRASAQGGYETAIHALIHDDNLSALRSSAEGAHVFRRYGLFGRVLDG